MSASAAATRARSRTDLLDHEAYPAAELAALYRERWEAESSYRQIKTFQRGPQQILRSASPELACQEAWAHLVVHHCLTRIIMELAAGARIDPDRISFLKVLKHVRRSVIARTITTAAKMTDFSYSSNGIGRWPARVKHDCARAAGPQ